jgi:transposase-like protein
MRMSKTYPAELKAEILGKIREGMTVREVERLYGANTKTVYKWLGNSAQGNGLLEASRLKRENEALYRLLGRMTYELKAGKKI